jgi:hypothetical protein
VNRVQGGLGVFGSVAPAVRRRLRVTAPFSQPYEGSYRYFGSPQDSARTLIIGLTVYLESSATHAGSPDAISGNYQARPGAMPGIQLSGAMLGFRRSDSLQFVFLNNQALSDTIEVFRARVVGDTITGTYRFRAGTWKFLKQR